MAEFVSRHAAVGGYWWRGHWRHIGEAGTGQKAGGRVVKTAGDQQVGTETIHFLAETFGVGLHTVEMLSLLQFGSNSFSSIGVMSPMRATELGPACLATYLFPELFQKANVKANHAVVSKGKDVDSQTQPVERISDIVGDPLAVAAARLKAGDITLEQNEELVAVSSCFEELFGYSKHELKGKSILRLLSMTGMADPQLEIYLNMVKQGMRMARGVQVSLRRKTGELVDSRVFIKKAVLPGEQITTNPIGPIGASYFFLFFEGGNSKDEQKSN